MINLENIKKSWLFLQNPSNIFLRKSKVCIFWEFLLSQALSTASFLRLNFSGFKKIEDFVSKDPSTFLKKTQFSSLWKYLNNSSTFCSNFATFSDFKKKRFFSEKPSFFLKRAKFGHFVKFFSVAFYGKFATLSDFG